MKLNKLIISIIFGSIFYLIGFAESKAQIVTGPITLSSQADVNAFVGSSINGSLTISGGDITNLSPLSTLTSISGDLDVNDNTALTNLDGLSGINSVGGTLGVATNAALSSYCGLYTLLSTPSRGGLMGQYFVTNNHVSNPNPTQQQIIDGGRCPFNGNVTLKTQAEVDAFGTHNYKGITGKLTVYETASGNITNLTPLSSLDSVGGFLYVGANTALAKLDGLSGLTSVSGNLEVSDNPALSSFCGLYTLLSTPSPGGLIGPYFVTKKICFLSKSNTAANN